MPNGGRSNITDAGRCRPNSNAGDDVAGEFGDDEVEAAAADETPCGGGGGDEAIVGDVAVGE